MLDSDPNGDRTLVREIAVLWDWGSSPKRHESCRLGYGEDLLSEKVKRRLTSVDSTILRSVPVAALRTSGRRRDVEEVSNFLDRDDDYFLTRAQRGPPSFKILRHTHLSPLTPPTKGEGLCYVYRIKYILINF